MVSGAMHFLERGSGYQLLLGTFVTFRVLSNATRAGE